MLLDAILEDRIETKGIKILRINKDVFTKKEKDEEIINIVTLIKENLVRIMIRYKASERKLIIESNRKTDDIKELKEEMIKKILNSIEEDKKYRLLALTNVLKIEVVETN